jgi:hypothetical protein
VKVDRSFVVDFELVIGFMQEHYPEAWPEPAPLVEEAKQAVRDDPEGGQQWYRETAQRIRETGWWC